jgi:hypothetical protein
MDEAPTEEIKAEETKPEESATEDKAPEEKPAAEETTAADEKPPAPPAVESPPTGVKPPAKHNWTLIALIAVSIVAILLLAATISMGVTGGGWEHHKGFKKFERSEGGQMFRGPMMNRDGGGWRGCPLLQKDTAGAAVRPVTVRKTKGRDERKAAGRAARCFSFGVTRPAPSPAALKTDRNI